MTPLPTPMTDEEIRKVAKARVGFRIHGFVVYGGGVDWERREEERPRRRIPPHP